MRSWQSFSIPDDARNYKEKIKVSVFNFIGHRIIPSRKRQMSDLWKVWSAFCHKACHPYTLHCVIKNESACYCQHWCELKAFQTKGDAAYQQCNTTNRICLSIFFFLEELRFLIRAVQMNLNTVICNDTDLSAFLCQLQVL